MHKCSLTATGWLVQAATLLEISTQLPDDISHGQAAMDLAIFCDSLSAVRPPYWPYHLKNYKA